MPSADAHYNLIRSPLSMVTREPRITRLIDYLVQARQEIDGAPEQRFTLQFRRQDLEEVRHAFAAMIRQGEKRLHVLAALMCDTLFGASFDMESVVVGEVEGSQERFMLTQPLSREVLYNLTDLDLGNRQLQRLRFLQGDEWSGATLIANFVEYHPHQVNVHGVHKIISRIKAEEELWNKVVDEIFDIDDLVRRDKQLRHMSRFVKDVFGLKIVVGEEDDVRRLHGYLQQLRWSAADLAAHDQSPDQAALDFIEVKDYLEDEQKASGWQAIKSVVRWAGETFEIQLQPMPNYHRERERLTVESHTGFKRSRETLRQQIAGVVPLFGFYQSLLRWLFLSPQGGPPSFNRVAVQVTE